jgi:hypothetical protein
MAQLRVRLLLVLFAGPLFIVQMFLCGFVEIKRYQDIIKPGSQGEKGTFLGFETAFKGTGEVGYPGGPFDFLGLSRCVHSLCATQQHTCSDTLDVDYHARHALILPAV